jgi:RNA polymerase sigma-70 factor (ECF subfamily)
MAPIRDNVRQAMASSRTRFIGNSSGGGFANTTRPMIRLVTIEVELDAGHAGNLQCGVRHWNELPGQFSMTPTMIGDGSSPDEARKRHFATTEWSVVLAAGEVDGTSAHDALAKLCAEYWYPLYAYVRRRVGDVNEAQDLTQAFFSHLLEKQTIAKADRSRGRFRAFLLTALKNFLDNEWHKQRAAKRGQGKPMLSLDFDSGESRYRLEPLDPLTPEMLYERRWVLTLLDQVLDELRQELAADGKIELFEHLKGAMTGEATADDYERAATALGTTLAAAKQAGYRLRKRYRQLFRNTVARTVAAAADVDDEISRLLAVLTE